MATMKKWICPECEETITAEVPAPGEWLHCPECGMVFDPKAKTARRPGSSYTISAGDDDLLSTIVQPNQPLYLGDDKPKAESLADTSQIESAINQAKPEEEEIDEEEAERRFQELLGDSPEDTSISDAESTAIAALLGEEEEESKGEVPPPPGVSREEWEKMKQDIARKQREEARKQKMLEREEKELNPEAHKGEETWFIEEDFEEFGPFTKAQIVRAARSGRINPETILKSNQTGKRFRAGVVPKLFPKKKPSELDDLDDIEV